MNLILNSVILQPGIQKVCADRCIIDLAVLVHVGFYAGCICIIGRNHLVQINVILVPVGCVLGQNVLLLRLIGGENEGSVVPETLIVKTEGIAVLIQACLRDRHIGGVGNDAREEGAGSIQLVNQRVVIGSFHADVLCAYRIHRLELLAVCIRILRSVLACQHVSGVVVISLCVVNHSAGVVHVLVVGLMRRIVYVACCRNPVVCRNISHFLAVVVDPLHTLTDVEGPLGHIVIGFPAFCKTGSNVSVLIIVHKAVDDIRADRVIIGGTRGQIVQSLYFSGIEGSERCLFSVLSASG